MDRLLSDLLCGALRNQCPAARQKASEPCPAVCAGSQTHQTSAPQTHAYHSAQTSTKDRKKADKLRALDSHWHLRNPLSSMPALSSGVTMTGPPSYQVYTNQFLPTGEPPIKSPFLHMEMKGCGPAQGGLPEVAGPGLACSRPPYVTLGDLLVNDQRCWF